MKNSQIRKTQNQNKLFGTILKTLKGGDNYITNNYDPDNLIGHFTDGEHTDLNKFFIENLSIERKEKIILDYLDYLGDKWGRKPTKENLDKFLSAIQGVKGTKYNYDFNIISDGESIDYTFELYEGETHIKDYEFSMVINLGKIKANEEWFLEPA